MNIKTRFEKIQRENPLYSSYSAFAQTISGSNITKRKLRSSFRELVEEGDFAENEREDVISHLLTLVNR
jgi:hypothetical protein